MKKAQKLPRFVDAIKRHASNIIPRLTLPRFYNLILNYYEMKFKKSQLRSYPFIAKIEAANVCNLKCLGCRSGDILVTYPAGRMEPTLFEKILDQNGKYLLEIIFYLWGEPTLNPNLPHLIKMAHERNISVTISTNLHFLDEKLSEKLLECRLDKLIIYLDGFSQKSYETVRIAGDFNKARKNLDYFARLRNKNNTGKPFIEWQYILTDGTFPELELAEKFADEIKINKFVVLQDWAGRLTNWRYFENLPGLRKQLSKKEKSCYWLYNAVTIQWDGGIFPCCYVANKGASLRQYGSLANDDFRNIWNSPQFVKAREFFKFGLTSDDIICCQCLSPPVFYTADEDRDKRIYD